MGGAHTLTPWTSLVVVVRLCLLPVSALLLVGTLLRVTLLLAVLETALCGRSVRAFLLVLACI